MRPLTIAERDQLVDMLKAAERDLARVRRLLEADYDDAGALEDLAAQVEATREWLYHARWNLKGRP